MRQGFSNRVVTGMLSLEAARSYHLCVPWNTHQLQEGPASGQSWSQQQLWENSFRRGLKTNPTKSSNLAQWFLLLFGKLLWLSFQDNRSVKLVDMLGTPSQIRKLEPSLIKLCYPMKWDQELGYPISLTHKSRALREYLCQTRFPRLGSELIQRQFMRIPDNCK